MPGLPVPLLPPRGADHGLPSDGEEPPNEKMQEKARRSVIPASAYQSLRPSPAGSDGVSSGSRLCSASRIASSAASRRSSGESPGAPACLPAPPAPPVRRRPRGGWCCWSPPPPPSGDWISLRRLVRALLIIAAAFAGARGPVPRLRRGLIRVALALRGHRRLRLLDRERAVDRRVAADVVQPRAAGRRAQAMVVVLDGPGDVAESPGPCSPARSRSSSAGPPRPAPALPDSAPGPGRTARAGTMSRPRHSGGSAGPAPARWPTRTRRGPPRTGPRRRPTGLAR